MASKGQIMTVSDVLTNGTIDEYIVGADASVFQTEYDSNGVLTEWTIDHPYNYIKSNMYGFYYVFGHDTPYMRARIGSSSMKLGNNAQTDDSDREYPFIYIDYDLDKHIAMNGGNSTLRMSKDSIDLDAGYSYIDMKYERMSLGSNNNIISFEHNKRPYFGTNSSNYVASYDDLKTWDELNGKNGEIFVYVSGDSPHDGYDRNSFYIHNRRTSSHYMVVRESGGYWLGSYDNKLVQMQLDGITQNWFIQANASLLSVGPNTIISNVDNSKIETKSQSIKLTSKSIELAGSNFSYIYSSNFGIAVEDRGIRFINIENASGIDALGINSNGYAYKLSGSSKRFKNSITPELKDELNPHKLYNIPVVQYKYNEDYLDENDINYNKEVIGFIAEDVYETYPVAASYTKKEDGEVEINNWNERFIIPPMLKLIQEQHQEIELLKEEIINLKKSLNK